MSHSLLHIALSAAAPLIKDKSTLLSIPEDLHYQLMKHMTEDQQILFFSKVCTWYQGTDSIHMENIYVDSRIISSTTYNTLGVMRVQCIYTLPNIMERTAYDEKGTRRGYQSQIDSLTHGNALNFYADGSLRSSSGWCHGRKHGSAKIFAGNGVLVSIKEFTDGRKNSYKTFHRGDGSIAYSVGYVSDERHGFKQQVIDGVVRICNEEYESKKEGLEEWFFRSGALRQSVEYKNGVKNGFHQRFREW